MPWNDNSNPGPWGSKGDGGKGGPGKDDRGGSGDDAGGRKPNPWGGGGREPSDEPPRRPRPNPPRGPGGGPPLKTPDIDELIRQLGERLRGFGFGVGRGGAPPRQVLAAILGAAFAIWALSGLFVVQPDQEAVVSRFGAYTRSEGPGLRYHLPTPVETVEKVSVTNLNRLDVGGAPGGAEVPAESLMLTGDENIVDLDFTVQWRVSDAASYLFRLTDPDNAVKMTAESAMREVIGKTQLQSILTTGRGQVQQQAADLMQSILDSWGAGITIVEVQIRSANPPEEVIAAFREVANAGQDAESSVNEGNTYRNRVINEAKGDAARIVQAAQAYREQVVREAQGEADRFAAIDVEYKHAPAVTRQRLYTETMERLLHNANKVIVDTPKGGTAPIVLPPDLLRRRDQTPAVTVQAPPDNQSQGSQQLRPMTQSRLILIAVGLVIGIVLIANSFYIVDQRKQAVVLRFGEPQRVVNAFRDNDPGLKLKEPFVENVILLDKRNQALEADQEEIIAADQERLVVDAFLRYRISDPLQFFRTLRDEHTASDRLERLVNSSLRQVLGSASSNDIISGRRAALMQAARADVTARAKQSQLGIDVIDVRIKRADLPQANQQAVYRRMQTSRQQEAAQIRAVGEQQKREIMANADREVTVTLATATEQSSMLRGDGDAKRTAIFAQSYGKDPSFAAFFRTMQAYDIALGQGDTTMVISPNSDFFKYYNNGPGK